MQILILEQTEGIVWGWRREWGIWESGSEGEGEGVGVGDGGGGGGGWGGWGVGGAGLEHEVR